MEITVNRPQMLMEMAFLQSLVERKESLSTLSNVHIKTDGDNKIILTATDLDNTLVLTMEAEVKTGGEMCISGKKLYDTLRIMDDKNFLIKTLPTHHVEIKCGKPKMRIVGSDPTNFPAVPLFQSASHSVPALMVRQIIAKASYAITNEPSRHTLSGAKVMLKDSSIKLVSTDGMRVVFIEYQNPNTVYASPLSILIPMKSLKEVAKLATQVDEVKFGKDNNHLYLKSGTRLLVSRLLTGKFPNYEMVLLKPEDVYGSIKLPVGELTKMLDRAILMADYVSNVIKLKFEKNKLTISGESTNSGLMEDFIDIPYDGEEFTVGMSSRYFKEFLSKNETGGKVFIEFNSEHSKFQIREDTENYDYKVIFSPMRL